MSYQIEFLDHDAFEALPYPDMETSLGVADPRTQRAFVRKTGIKAVDLFNAAHELEHLQEGHAGAHADHYRNGVYYKDFMQTLSPAYGASQGNFGPLLSTVGSMFGMPMLGNLVGGQQKQQQQPQAQTPVMSQFQNADQGNTPNVVQASAGVGGGSAAGGPSGSGGLGQIQQQLYGKEAGR